jgi:hypothetical protein
VVPPWSFEYTVERAAKGVGGDLHHRRHATSDAPDVPLDLEPTGMRDSEGALHIDGQDLGPGTSPISDDGEYEWFQTIRAEHLPRLVQLLGGESGRDVMGLLAERFTGAGSYELERILREGGIPIEFSSRSG